CVLVPSFEVTPPLISPEVAYLGHPLRVQFTVRNQGTVIGRFNLAPPTAELNQRCRYIGEPETGVMLPGQDTTLSLELVPLVVGKVSVPLSISGSGAEYKQGMAPRPVMVNMNVRGAEVALSSTTGQKNSANATERGSGSNIKPVPTKPNSYVLDFGAVPALSPVTHTFAVSTTSLIAANVTLGIEQNNSPYVIDPECESFTLAPGDTRFVRVTAYLESTSRVSATLLCHVGSPGCPDPAVASTLLSVRLTATGTGSTLYVPDGVTTGGEGESVTDIDTFLDSETLCHTVTVENRGKESQSVVWAAVLPKKKEYERQRAKALEAGNGEETHLGFPVLNASYDEMGKPIPRLTVFPSKAVITPGHFQTFTVTGQSSLNGLSDRGGVRGEALAEKWCLKSRNKGGRDSVALETTFRAAFVSPYASISVDNTDFGTFPSLPSRAFGSRAPSTAGARRASTPAGRGKSRGVGTPSMNRRGIGSISFRYGLEDDTQHNLSLSLPLYLSNVCLTPQVWP
ncbi:hypothetical protein KIPB_010255, partial [Kipferlia bialata]